MASGSSSVCLEQFKLREALIMRLHEIMALQGVLVGDLQSDQPEREMAFVTTAFLKYPRSSTCTTSSSSSLFSRPAASASIPSDPTDDVCNFQDMSFTQAYVSWRLGLHSAAGAHPGIFFLLCVTFFVYVPCACSLPVGIVF